MVFLAVTVCNISAEVRSRVTLHCVQLLPEQGFRENETYSTLTLPPGQKEEVVVPLVVRVAS